MSLLRLPRTGSRSPLKLLDPHFAPRLHRLACYLLPSPVCLSRLHIFPESNRVLYEPRSGRDADESEAIDLLEFLARVLLHILRSAVLRRSPATSHSLEAARMRTIPEPRKHVVHFFGAYAHRVRSACPRRVEQAEAEHQALPKRAAISKRWAELLAALGEAMVLRFRPPS